MTNCTLLTALLDRLAPHMSEGVGISSGAASALQVLASEVSLLAEQEAEEDTQEGLERLSALFLEVALLIERSERRWSRLAFDLHDSILQEVAALRMLLSGFRSRLWTTRATETNQVDHVGEFLDQVDTGLQSLDRGLRELVESFESPAVADQPLEDSMRAYIREFMSSTAVSVTVDFRGDFEILSRSQRIALFRILVEALTNVRQHSGASRVWVTVRVADGRARLRVRDNGEGFEPRRTPPLAAKRGGRGLLGMAERVRFLGGQFDLNSQRGGPTTITVAIPAGHVDELQLTLRKQTKKAVRRR